MFDSSFKDFEVCGQKAMFCGHVFILVCFILQLMQEIQRRERASLWPKVSSQSWKYMGCSKKAVGHSTYLKPFSHKG